MIKKTSKSFTKKVKPTTIKNPVRIYNECCKMDVDTVGTSKCWCLPFKY